MQAYPLLSFLSPSSSHVVMTIRVCCFHLFAFLHLNGVEVETFNEIDHHIVGKLFWFTIPLCGESLIQCHAFSQLRTSPRERDEFFQAFVSNGWIAKSAKIATRPIHDHPDLPQVRFGMFDDPTRYFTQTTRSMLLLWREWLETTCIVSLGLGPSPDLLQGLFERVGILWAGCV